MGLLKRAGVEIGAAGASRRCPADHRRRHRHRHHAPVQLAAVPPVRSRLQLPEAPVDPVAIDTSSRYVELDLKRLDSMGLVVPSSPRSQIAEEFRVIKRPILANAHGKGAAPVDNGNLIMVTSSVPGRGRASTPSISP
jgi:protein-tyrosine kinase